MITFLDQIAPQLNRVGAMQQTHWIGPRRVIYDHELLLVSKGECRTDIGGKIFHNEADTFIIKPPGIPHSSSQKSRGVIRFHWAHFNWMPFEEQNHQSPFVCYLPNKPNPSLIRPAPEIIPQAVWHGRIESPSYIYQLFDRLNERWNFGTHAERTGCRAIFLEIVLALLGPQTGAQTQAPRSTPNNHLAEKVRNYLGRLLELPQSSLSLQTEITRIGYSYPHLCRVFSKTYGISPVAYLNNLRMERAAMLLQDTEIPISSIAHKVGIDNPAYFARLFTRYSGKSPRVFRRSRSVDRSTAAE